MKNNEIMGHKDIIARLDQAVKNEHIASAFLFSGPDGIGKKLVALRLAQALNCRQFNSEGPCQQCASCRKIATLNHVEVKVISREEKAKNLKIEQIFQLQADISLRPVEAAKKVYIIDDAHTLTRDAANCLLKTLEEPPQDSLLILVTANPAVLLATVRSRCQKIEFKPLPLQEVTRRLQEQGSLESEPARFLADFAGGSLGQAQVLLEKGILEKKAELDEFIEGMQKEDIPAVLARAQAFGRDKEQAKIWLDLLLYACAREYRSVGGLRKPGFERYEEILELILRAKRNLVVNVNLQLVLENIFLRMRHA